MSDETLNHESVKAYRDQFKFCPKIGYREDIIKTVRNMELWKQVLRSWGYFKNGKWIKFNPLSVGKMLSEYERREKNIKPANDAVPGQPESNGASSPQGVSERGNGHLSRMRQGAGLHVRRSEKTFEEILAGALRQED